MKRPVPGPWLVPAGSGLGRRGPGHGPGHCPRAHNPGRGPQPRGRKCGPARFGRHRHPRHFGAILGPGPAPAVGPTGATTAARQGTKTQKFGAGTSTRVGGYPWVQLIVEESPAWYCYALAFCAHSPHGTAIQHGILRANEGPLDLSRRGDSQKRGLSAGSAKPNRGRAARAPSVAHWSSGDDCTRSNAAREGTTAA